MRSALLFALRLLIPAMVLAYVLVMLAASCLPVADSTGQAQAIPRWEYWLLYASVPSAIWWQWTGGLQPIVISDRIPILFLAAGWLVGSWLVGKWISLFDPMSRRLSKYESIGVSILIGQSVLSAIVFLSGWLLGTHFLVWILALVFATTIVLLRFQSQSAREDSHIEKGSELEVEEDTSFASSISRRMVGLLVLSTIYLACIQVVGATIPTHDMHVREVDWWLAKHSTLDGRIHWSAENTMVNEPTCFAMPSLAFISMLTLDLPSVHAPGGNSIPQRERWNNRLYLGVLAGKTVNAMLCLVGVILVGVHLGRRWGYLQGLFVCFLLLATPGIAELTRLGRTEALIGIWGAALLVVWHAGRNRGAMQSELGLMWGFLLAGAVSSGYGSAVLVGIPAIVLWCVCCLQRSSAFTTESKWKELDIGWSTKLIASSLLGCTLFAASSYYLRNLIASGDPIYPWGGVVAQQLGIMKQSDIGNAMRDAYRVPSEASFEANEAAISDSAIATLNESQSPYRWENVLDAFSRVLWNSNAHGLMLVPFAFVGMGNIPIATPARTWFAYWRSPRSGKRRNPKTNLGWSAGLVAIVWFVYWLSIWWFFSTRQDRDWVGAMILLAWPAANGAGWMAKRAQGYFMMIVVSIGIVWSVVVIPIWPTSDNRMLVALQSLDGAAEWMGSKSPDADAARTESYTDQFNTIMRGSEGIGSAWKVLLIGENDDFELLADCISNGSFNLGLMDRWRDLPTNELGLLFRSHGISHVLVVWSGVQYRDRLTGMPTEGSYRSAIGKLERDSQLTPILWEINASYAELFQVNEK